MKIFCQNIDVFSEFVMTMLSNGYIYHEYHTLDGINFQIYKAFPLIRYLESAVFDWYAPIWFFYATS